MRILLVEDETALREQLGKRLQREGYVVESAATGSDAQYLGLEYPIDLAILDLGLPDTDGISVLRHWREQASTFPVLILTARGRWQDKVAGLEAGADDYLVKPFQTEELLARLNALLRRSTGHADPQIHFGPLCIDTAHQQVLVQQQVLDLTAFEYRVMEYLGLHAGEVVSKSTLTQHLYSDDDERDSNVLEVIIGRLRKKLDSAEPQRFIETLRGRGYRLRDDSH